MSFKYTDCEPVMQQLLDEYEEFVGEVRDALFGFIAFSVMLFIVVTSLLP